MEPAVQDTIPVISRVRVKDFVVECPNCKEYQEGWIGDPRGLTERCDACGQTYKVAADAVLVTR